MAWINGARLIVSGGQGQAYWPAVGDDASLKPPGTTIAGKPELALRWQLVPAC